jgi:AhpD family alkylhydroperoxidase
MAEDNKRWFEKQAPQMAEGWWNFYNAVEGETVLDKKTKALIAVAVVVHGRCPHCTESRIKKALALGISKQEIGEAIMETALLSSGTQIFWAKEVYDKYLG